MAARLLLIAALIFLTAAAMAAQGSSPLSLCEVMKHPQKYKGKEILIRGIYKIAAETSPLEPGEECPKYEPITAGPDKHFESFNTTEMVEIFEKATDLRSAIPPELSRPGLPFCCIMRMNITASGLLIYSHKKKLGPFNGYRIAFLIRRIEDINNARMIIVGSTEDRTL